ncbi:5-formyltetrahydrofolate cyclo-ligase [Desmospora profundinema]|uniref:5-formyltetrahydrofolate cyclo-ligase n=1 Tax=Desmospora profundinema TaxID=1571184 RepID=A0ABU1ILS9_9BACL|nr:5-formyltetrahydrofolate cyclo-ligase [Desmospora profundinema]MDR6225740.1 5-formyltetrahydrofolate cyclo-ligase [Desmospora profundinema]
MTPDNHPAHSKTVIRERVWSLLEEKKAGRFPFPLRGRIPNFKGAEAAAHHITQLAVYQQAQTIKVNPDSPQLPLRAQALRDGKTLLVPTPRLKAGFIRVDPDRVPAGEERKAASLSHIHEYGVEIPLEHLPPVDLFVVGAVALHRDGRRLGKGEGYADREYAVLRESGNPEIPVVSSVHSLQVVDDDIPLEPHDLTVDWIATEQELIQTNPSYPKPAGINWGRVTEEELDDMPILKKWKERLERS